MEAVGSAGTRVLSRSYRPPGGSPPPNPPRPSGLASPAPREVGRRPCVVPLLGAILREYTQDAVHEGGVAEREHL